MQATHEQMVDFLRMVHARAGGTGAILNLIRASEVRGGADLLTLTDLVSDPQLKMDLARHAMDEARHSYLLLRRMNEIGFSCRRLPRVSRARGSVRKGDSAHAHQPARSLRTLGGSASLDGARRRPRNDGPPRAGGDPPPGRGRPGPPASPGSSLHPDAERRPPHLRRQEPGQRWPLPA